MTESRKSLLINCDMGESFGTWQMGQDQEIMPYIDMANIACGFHAGDANVMQRTVMLALQYNVKIGAHPAYPDLQGFGRRSMTLAKGEIRALMCYQLGALEGITKACGGSLHHVKPHGALYNDMMRDKDTLLQVIQAVSDYDEELLLVLQATSRNQEHQELAAEYGVNLCFEAFSDRAYQDDGLLVPRNQQGALLSKDEAIAQARAIMQQGKVSSVRGTELTMQIDTLCIHGDGSDALPIARQLYEQKIKDQ
ncbi:5-oxoprolinase subunit PxpA [Planctobacterium marinum]|uniref:UPF0271 protein n=1 Tax=Planctobacterium marinum TaxID=1631968 RepID=A0AA48KQU1_9ALTE|nr:UPF0271 protein [Planctobacterium marinum]